MIEPETIDLDDLPSTDRVAIPKDALDRVIGQEHAIRLAKMAARQRRHLLVVGPPGTGKSMMAQALANHLPKPSQQIEVVHNPENPERPFAHVVDRDDIRARDDLKKEVGTLRDPKDVPKRVAEELGYICSHCNEYSSPGEVQCPNCQQFKGAKVQISSGGGNNPFAIIGTAIPELMKQMGGGESGRKKVRTTRRRGDQEEVVVFEREGEKIRELDEAALKKRKGKQDLSNRKILIPAERNTFVLATGASSTELLGDVRHDPYGGAPGVGTPPYKRVVAGSIHEAHEGVLFVDELPHLGNLQRNILTAMQEKIYPITGHNPQSAGASVKVTDVPCDFLFVGACNITDLPSILSPLRSRIAGGGYEILVETTMKDEDTNLRKLVQFAAQEVTLDGGRIPHLDASALPVLFREARDRAKKIDGQEGSLTLRLRELGGVIRSAGDLARMGSEEFVTAEHMKEAIETVKPVEQQIRERYGSYQGGLARDLSEAQRTGGSPYDYWQQHLNDDKMGYD